MVNIELGNYRMNRPLFDPVPLWLMWQYSIHRLHTLTIQLGLAVKIHEVELNCCISRAYNKRKTSMVFLIITFTYFSN